MIFDIILYILLTIIVLLVIIVSIKITFEIECKDEDITVFVKFLVFKLDILKIVKKFKNKKNKDTQENKPSEKEESSEKKEFSWQKIDQYISILEDVLDVLEQFAFCVTLKKCHADVFIQTNDNALTGKTLGSFWALYGNVTVFLYRNFLIDDYKIDFVPVWDKDKFKISSNAHIIVCTSIFRILINIKYKKLIEIRKKALL